MRIRILAVAALVAGSLVPGHAQEGKVPAEDPAHEQLRTLRREMVQAINTNNIDALLTHLDKDVVVTWMNGEVSRKPEGVREYIERMTKGPNHMVNSYTTEAEVEDLTHLYGDTGVAYGHSNDRFVLTDGSDFVVNTRWSTTVVKKDGKWIVANFHASTNMFDNPLLYIAVRRAATWTALIAVVVGLAIGVIGMRVLRRRHAPT
ncbi:MAG TPA: nuclear transport factor 2 family protein [Gemmataceae bacterium]|jgi:hypothetical protein|nr:nuclear transport factor 2 family protein [Gemmataceae bacterium]